MAEYHYRNPQVMYILFQRLHPPLADEGSRVDTAYGNQLQIGYQQTGSPSQMVQLLGESFRLLPVTVNITNMGLNQ